MEITQEQRRALIGLACRVAWADGVVAPEERRFVTAMVGRFAPGDVDDDELEAWLAHRPSDDEIEAIPEALGEMFVYEALQLIEADGEIDDQELTGLESIFRRLFGKKSPGIPLAQIAVSHREVPSLPEVEGDDAPPADEDDAGLAHSEEE